MAVDSEKYKFKNVDNAVPENMEDEKEVVRGYQKYDKGDLYKLPHAAEVYFGLEIPDQCGGCSFLSKTGRGHGFCEHVDCTAAVFERKRRLRRRTSVLEQIYIPKMKADTSKKANE